MLMNVVSHFRDSSRGMELPSLREIELTRQDKKRQLRGFYMDYRKYRVGIVATQDGPVFFSDGHFYLLREHTFEFSLQRRKGKIVFRFEWNGEMKLSFTYPRVFYRDGCVWEADETRDFCSWLVNAVKRSSF